MAEEDRMREEAARRMERRRKKMENSEERLAKITGQPVGSGPRVSLDLPSLSYYEIASNGIALPASHSDGTGNHRFLADDPPLEHLVRSAEPAAASPAKQCSNLVWVLLAACVFFLLQSPWAYFLSQSAVLPFLLTFISLCVTGHISLQPSSAVSSLVSAALQLCGLNPKLVRGLLTGLAALRSLLSCFTVYLLSLICFHVMSECLHHSRSWEQAAAA